MAYKIPKEIQKLANYLMKEWQGDIGGGDPIHGESAVDCAIRLLSKLKLEKSILEKEYEIEYKANHNNPSWR